MLRVCYICKCVNILHMYVSGLTNALKTQLSSDLQLNPHTCVCPAVCLHNSEQQWSYKEMVVLMSFSITFLSVVYQTNIENTKTTHVVN